MADIDIQYPNPVGLDKARKAVDQIAAKLGDQLGVQCEWQGDELHFSRSGVKGSICVDPAQVRVTAKLGLLLGAMKGTIEQEIQRLLKEKLG